MQLVVCVLHPKPSRKTQTLGRRHVCCSSHVPVSVATCALHALMLSILSTRVTPDTCCIIPDHGHDLLCWCTGHNTPLYVHVGTWKKIPHVLRSMKNGPLFGPASLFVVLVVPLLYLIVRFLL